METMVKTVKQGCMSASVLKMLQDSVTVTVAEVKTQLKGNYPDFAWTRAEISTFMNDMHLKGALILEDNGSFRGYTGETKKVNSVKKDPKGKKLPKIKMTNISKAKAWDLMIGNHGRFFTAEFVKKNKDVRVMNCLCLQKQDSKLGYVQVKEASLMRSDPDKAIRQINMQTLKSLKIGGIAYKIK